MLCSVWHSGAGPLAAGRRLLVYLGTGPNASVSQSNDSHDTLCWDCFNLGPTVPPLARAHALLLLIKALCKSMRAQDLNTPGAEAGAEIGVRLQAPGAALDSPARNRENARRNLALHLCV